VVISIYLKVIWPFLTVWTITIRYFHFFPCGIWCKLEERNCHEHRFSCDLCRRVWVLLIFTWFPPYAWIYLSRYVHISISIVIAIVVSIRIGIRIPGHSIPSSFHPRSVVVDRAEHPSSSNVRIMRGYQHNFENHPSAPASISTPPPTS